MIKKIELRNFKCFERLELPLSNLNLLSGINSMGKSTVIQALLLLRQAYEKDSLREGLYLNGEYTQIGTGLDLLYFNADGDIEIILTNETGQKYRWILDYVPDSDYLKIKKEESEGKDTGILENLNLLNQDFHAKKPNEKWVSDIRYIHTKQGTLYLAVMKDLFDHSIVTYEMGTRQDNGLITRLIEKAKRQIRKGTVIHSDQGGQYSSKEYFLLSEKCGFIPSMSRKATPLDNACAESFFSTLKTECIYRHTIKTLDDAKQLIRSYIYFYNHQRIQLSTGCTPLEKRRFTA